MATRSCATSRTVGSRSRSAGHSRPKDYEILPGKRLDAQHLHPCSRLPRASHGPGAAAFRLVCFRVRSTRATR
eukprot:2887919-Lingulodinium_polyedra.AAC.1